MSSRNSCSCQAPSECSRQLLVAPLQGGERLVRVRRRLGLRILLDRIDVRWAVGLADDSRARFRSGQMRRNELGKARMPARGLRHGVVMAIPRLEHLVN